MSKNTSETYNGWLSANPQKRLGEVFFLRWHIAWLAFFGGIVVTKAYETFDEWSYTKVGLIVGVPPILLPLLFPRISGEHNIPWNERFTTKANAFIFVMSWVGNYFWTHYFYKVLGTDYTFPAHRFNDVPIACYLLTHSYFHFYHGFSSIALRALWRKIAGMGWVAQYAVVTLCVLMMSYFTAVLEVVSIASFPYYTYPDVYKMWVIGSVFYGIYFVLSYPMFYRIDEEVVKVKTDAVVSPHHPYRFTLGNVFKDAFAWGMATTIMLDLWRLGMGSLNGPAAPNVTPSNVSWIN